MTVDVPAAGGQRLPKVLEAYIGGYFGTSYAVELTDGEIVYRRSRHREGAEEEPIVVSPTPEAWEAFLSECDRLRVWRWRPEYPNPGVCDGTGWSLSLEAGDRSVSSSGDNAFPRGFVAFRRALRRLLGGLDFE